MSLHRRTFIAALGGLAAAPAVPGLAADTKRTRVVLLGTKGGPTPSVDRASSSTMLVIDGKAYIVDCGNGVARQMVAAGVMPDKVANIFITHNHSDHVIDVGTLLVLAWAVGLKSPVGVFGPPPIEQIVRDGLAVSNFDMEARIREEGRPPLPPLVKVQPVDKGGVILRTPEVTVTVAVVDHMTVKPALAYRFDTPDRSVVISGDTTRSEALIELARDADVLIHEAMYLPGIDRFNIPNAPSLREHLVGSHTTTEQLGVIAAEARVKKLVLSHLVPGSGDPIPDALWLEGVRKAYSGPAVVGRDLMEV